MKSERSLKSEWVLAEPLAMELSWDGETLTNISLTWAEGRTATKDLSEAGTAFQDALERYVAGEDARWPDITPMLDAAELTDFSRSVLKALAEEVPHGQKVSYGWLAAKAGKPKAARAVGRVMASNRWPLLIPCHRVVGSDGKLTGFSGTGLPMKQYLLDLEMGSAGT
jgi:methylated-DNA-[protein]-cysteine S-methyltransferase